MNPPQNVDPREIAHFNRISQRWWDPQGKMGMLHVINPLRSQFILRHIPDPAPRLVDIGCGGGILSEALARSGAQVVGIDQAQETLTVATQHAGQSSLDIEYRNQTVEQLAAQEPASFDAVTCMEMLEHVPDPEAVVVACARLLRPGGRAFFSTINRTPKAFLFAIVGGEYVLRLLPRGTHHYAKLVRPQELRSWAAACKLEYVDSASLMYNPFSRTFKLAEDREDVNYMISFVKKG
ncbi:MAG: bifunctional 2-polyprenyl-6-hydroxyphenol methylase/3-demethylubiquinol 3-O-methyltransferase UbiG [Castellaniella sp.]|uniref:bifunctional 2-polyprenyl-6-hydroxyphenol methylase/3-demethylubiquinol 3-O-methyltransferase UbiG n=1 Tax=Castellaniella sp. TaxID=1955812 RepID=UPI0012158257|nr:bifunctional 2-polyprenyl-6-hydroxyphenol methylase/3-demethylubiquinol 3-O-methyltransferase UbiG [Castellaniella sp.]TAN28081.1 MAG: bifunctional 2-polyprenyl-6-hydroxyphenol methylase/3-demethylubiquinol 3-O-methyltransferase UbiG [Castellaniella sp.]